MKSKLIGVLMALAVLSAPAWAERGGHPGSGWHGNGRGAASWHGPNNGSVYNGWGWQNGNQPPGWSHGRKTGWGDCNMPPGQAKKQGGCGFWNGWRPRDGGRDARWRRDRWHGNGDNDDDDRGPMVRRQGGWRRPSMNRQIPAQPLPPSGTVQNWPAPAPAPSPQPVWRRR